MLIRQVRILGSHLLVAMIALVSFVGVLKWKERQDLVGMAGKIADLCELPDLPEGMGVRHALIDQSADTEVVDVFLSITGSKELVRAWMKEMDEWELRRPGVVLNYRLREAERSSRVDLTAEVFLP